jgi:glutathione synthase/RimK-type ligase-like ATP-grasp enzyme
MSDKPYIGIMYPRRLIKQMTHPTLKLKQQLSYIEEEAKENGVIPCFFGLQNIRAGGYFVTAYVLGKDGYQRQVIPRPKVVYNRIVDIAKVRPKIHRLMMDGVTFFNVRNRDYGKLPILSLLAKDSSIFKHIPHTLKATTANIKEMMSRYNSLILKPNLGAVGRGVLKLERVKDKWCFSYTLRKRHKQIRRQIYFQSKLPLILRKHIRKSYYIVQERINLATYQNSPFDIRVAVQRNKKGEWEPTAFITKVAGNGHYITNVTQGGTTYPLKTILEEHAELNHEKVTQDISDFTIRVANYLSQYLPHIGCLGMDIGLTKDGTPYFIEVNYISDFTTLVFRENRLVHEDWKKVYKTPVAYAAYIVKGR